MDKKPWYKSLTIWAGILGILVGCYIQLDTEVFADALPNIPASVLAILATLGIYGRAKATTEIEK